MQEAQPMPHARRWLQQEEGKLPGPVWKSERWPSTSLLFCQRKQTAQESPAECCAILSVSTAIKGIKKSLSQAVARRKPETPLDLCLVKTWRWRGFAETCETKLQITLHCKQRLQATCSAQHLQYKCDASLRRVWGPWCLSIGNFESFLWGQKPLPPCTAWKPLEFNRILHRRKIPNCGHHVVKLICTCLLFNLPLLILALLQKPSYICIYNIYIYAQCLGFAQALQRRGFPFTNKW